jgi:site-specific DNA-cytosine methylase
MHLASIEICAGAGGQAFGLEQAGFAPQVLIEIAQVVTYKLNLLIFRSGDLKTAFYRDTSA